MTNIKSKTIGFAASLTAAFLTAGLLAALLAQLWFKIAPCPLCLQQRWPYFAGIPLALGIAYLARRRFPVNLVKCLQISLLAMLALSLFLGIQHSGVEWGLWAAPASCAAAGGEIGSAKELRYLMNTYHFVSCERAQKLFGVLSFANLNALLSLFLLALNAAVLLGYDQNLRTRRRSKPSK